MSVTYHQTQIKTISLNGTDLNSATYHSTQVFLKSSSRLITNFATAHTDQSYVPPPYDSNGYNFSGTAPEKTATLTISIGNTTGFNAIKFDWDNDGSLHGYGGIHAYISEWDGNRIDIYDTELNQSGQIVLPIYQGMPENLVIQLTAKSQSSYRGFIEQAYINLRNVMLITTT